LCFGLANGPVNAPTVPVPSKGQVFPLERHGTVYLTRAEWGQQRFGLALMIGSVGVACLAFVVWRVRVGEITVSNTTWYKSRDPADFWTYMTIIAVLGIV